MTDTTPLTVFYDGACPLCLREIGFYRRRKGAEALRWVDVSAVESGEVAPGLSKEQAMARFHVRDSGGVTVSGGEAFARLWRELPGFRVMGRVFALPPLVWLLNRSYDYFLRFRPWLQRLAGAGGRTGAEVCEGVGRCSSVSTAAKATVPARRAESRNRDPADA